MAVPDWSANKLDATANARLVECIESLAVQVNALLIINQDRETYESEQRERSDGR